VRAISLHPDVLVATSEVWQTTCTAVRSGGEAFVIDSPVYPDELELLPTLMQQAQFIPKGLLVTHGDWDHVLARMPFPDASVGVAETTAARLRAEPGDAQRELRKFDEQGYVERPRPLQLGSMQALPVPGKLELGGGELELIPADGHTQDGMAIWSPAHRVLCCGDYLSPVEIPMLNENGSRDAYLATLERLRPYVEQAAYVVPGHGSPVDGARALAILREDAAYLQALPDPAATLPLARRTGAQRKVHQDNVSRMGGTA